MYNVAGRQVSMEEAIEAVRQSVQMELEEWWDFAGRSCLRLVREVGVPALEAVAGIMQATDRLYVQFNCASMLVRSDLSESGDFLVRVLQRPFSEDVLVQIFQYAGARPRVAHHKEFVELAEDLSRKTQLPAIRAFLEEVRLSSE